MPRIRVACPRCGPKLERLAWLEPYARVTRRLAESVGHLCAVMALRHVASYFDLNWKTVKQLDRQRLERTLGPVDLDGVEVIALDEFAIQKGHRYATVVDMNASYELEVRRHCPNAVVVFDLFHLSSLKDL